MNGEQRIVVLGAAGQLGGELCAELSGSVVPLTRSELDLTNAGAVRRKLTELQPTLIINCAAYNFVDKAEDEPEVAFAVNAFAVRRLAQVCRALEATLVHFSTDYVFGADDARQSPYRESDLPGPINIYGMSKLAGESFVRSECEKHFIIRTCGLYGHRGSGGKGTNFVETMLRLASQGKPIRVVTDQICTPTYTAGLAAAVIQLIQAAPYGLYHLTNAGECSWYGFTEAIFEIAGVQADLSATTTNEYGSRARRPKYSVLTSEHSQTPRLRPWREALRAYLSSRKKKATDER